MYIVRLAKNPHEIEIAHNLVKEFFTKFYKTYPTEIPEFVLVGENADTGEIVSTISIDTKPRGSTKLLEVEKYFEFSFNDYNPDIPKRGVGEPGRWVSRDQRLTIHLLKASFRLIKMLNLGYISTFLKRKIGDLAINKYKLPFVVLPAEPKESLKNGPYKNYFATGDLVIFIQRTEIVLDSVEKNFANDKDVLIQLPDSIQELEKYKTCNYGIESLS